MLVNIWATITHLGDVCFNGADLEATPSLDVLICDRLGRTTRHNQTWMINPCWLEHGTTGRLLRESYTTLRDSSESYLVLLAPGFADVAGYVSVDTFDLHVRELCRRSRAFNKRVIGLTLGIPPGTPKVEAARVEAMNEVIGRVVPSFNGEVIDLRSIEYLSWSAQGSRPRDFEAVADKIAEGVLRAHAGSEAWRVLHAAN